MALFKMNVLQFYTEHTFHFARHPRIGQDCGSLTPQDILELDAYCRDRHLELMPNLQSFGHCEHILNLPEYRPLAESAALWSLSLADEGSYQLLDELYGDMLPSFTSRTLNIGCDETYDLGKGRSAAVVEAQGLGRVYLGHILRLRELAAHYGFQIQLWGDILLHHPQLVSEVPDDVTLLDWHYEAADDYPSTKLFGEHQRRFWVCPDTSSWNTLFPRIENSNGNIKTLARVGIEHGAGGMLNTDWDDGGHYQPLGQC
ncbi:MAG: family 20 glycosylhydrolase [Chloroflexi bacterium]|nr:family 20 glycosylhydrolase [Chloroflexota bacterium]